MIKFEADPVVGQAEGSGLGWGKHIPRISIKWRRRAPKGASCLVSLLRFLRYLNTLAVDPMRRSLTALIRACHRSNEVRSTGHLCHVFPLCITSLHCFRARARPPFLFRDHPPVFISRTCLHQNQFHSFLPRRHRTPLAGPDLATCIHRQSGSPSGCHRK